MENIHIGENVLIKNGKQVYLLIELFFRIPCNFSSASQGIYTVAIPLEWNLLK